MDQDEGVLDAPLDPQDEQKGEDDQGRLVPYLLEGVRGRLAAALHGDVEPDHEGGGQEVVPVVHVEQGGVVGRFFSGITLEFHGIRDHSFFVPTPTALLGILQHQSRYEYPEHGWDLSPYLYLEQTISSLLQIISLFSSTKSGFFSEEY